MKPVFLDTFIVFSQLTTNYGSYNVTSKLLGYHKYRMVCLAFIAIPFVSENHILLLTGTGKIPNIQGSQKSIGFSAVPTSRFFMEQDAIKILSLP